MSAGVRIPLAEAQLVAATVMRALEPACELALVAGSVRRKQPEVGDIEIVCKPRTHEAPLQVGAFDASVPVLVSDLDAHLDALEAARVLVAHPDDPKRGTRYAKLEHPDSGMQVDVFSVLPPAQFGVLYLIRTGPARYSQWIVGSKARSRGLHVKDGALHRGSLGCTARPCEVVPIETEADVFAALQMAPVPPELRT